MGGRSFFNPTTGASLKEFTFSKRNLFLILLTILLTGAGLILIQQFAPRPSAQTPTPLPEETEAAKAAVEGTQAFFQIQIDLGKDAWLNHFCSLSTENGCAMTRMGADRLWKKYAEAKTSVQATAKALEQVSKTANEQVWKVEVTLSEPLPGSNKTQDDAYVLAVKTDTGWKFDRFLLEPEVKALQERQKKEGGQ
jgi:hypothetical protein